MASRLPIRLLALGLLLAASGTASASEFRFSRLSLGQSAREADGPSRTPAASADGSAVAFASTAANLVEGDLASTDDRDVFVLDRLEGRLENVSQKVDEGIGSWFWKTDCRNPDLSTDGIEVVYQCFSGYHFAHGMKDHIHRHNRLDGTTRLISNRPDGIRANGGHWNPRISGDGRYSLFTGTASNMVAGDTNRVADIFLHDDATGLIERLSVSEEGVEADGPSDGADLSYDGRLIVFVSRASNLTPESIGGTDQVLLLDRETGSLRRIAAGTQPAISLDGRFVSFTSPPSGATGFTDVYLYDAEEGSLSLVSRSPEGLPADGSSFGSRLSEDGAQVSFLSRATNLVSDDGGALPALYLFDRPGGTLHLVAPEIALSPAPPAQDADLSADGRTLVFATASGRLDPDDRNGQADIYAAALATDTEPPVIVARLDRQSLWPPNGKLVDILLEGEVTDNVGVTSLTIRISDEYGEFDGLELPGFGPFQLRAYRDGGDRDGRQYKLSLTATDAAGNTSVTELPLVVPHDLGKR